jgi:hypothetical protein
MASEQIVPATGTAGLGVGKAVTRKTTKVRWKGHDCLNRQYLSPSLHRHCLSLLLNRRCLTGSVGESRQTGSSKRLLEAVARAGGPP